jgi:Lysozyme like domain
MRQRRAWLSTACVLAAVASLAMPPAAAAPPLASPTRPPASFVEALAAIPDSTAALAVARQALVRISARHVAAARAAASAGLAYAMATRAVHETGGVLVRAQLADGKIDRDIDDAARTMYMSGGTAPSLAEVLLTADSEEGFTRSLVLRQHLVAVGESAIYASGVSARALRDAAAAASHARVDREAAGTRAAAAHGELAVASRDLADAEAAVQRAQKWHRKLIALTSVDRSDEYGRIKRCGDWLTRLLSRNGFAGENLREAWAIVMRESGGNARSVSRTGDLGLFQINTETWQDEEWFDRKLLLTKRYNTQVARQISRGGRSWYSWGLDGHGRADPRAYVKAGWSAQRIRASIVLPYIRWYAQYPCRPSYERNIDVDSLVGAPPVAVRG